MARFLAQLLRRQLVIQPCTGLAHYYEEIKVRLADGVKQQPAYKRVYT